MRPSQEPAAAKPATEANRRRALTFVVNVELTDAKVGSAIVGKDNGVLLNALGEPWKAMAVAALKRRAIEIHAEQRKLLDSVLKEGIAAMDGVAFPLSNADIDVLVASDPAQPKYLQSAVGGNYAYVLGFITPEPTWKSFVKTWTAELKATKELIERAGQLQPIADNQFRMLQDARTAATPVLDNLGVRIQQVEQDVFFAVIAKPLIDEAKREHRVLVERIEACSDTAFQNLVLTLAVEDLSVLTDDDVNAHCVTLTILCSQARTDASDFINWLSAERFGALRAVLTGAGRKSAFTAFLALFGIPGFGVLNSLTDIQRPLILDRWTEVSAKVLEKSPANSTYGLVRKYVLLACTGGTAELGRKAVEQGAPVVRIDVAGNVTVHCWGDIKGVQFPRGFSRGSYSTDAACIKHVAQEVGPNPTKVKLTAYFADMVAACDAASVAWAKSSYKTSVQHKVKIGRATWCILIGTAHGREVYHVDSGYEKSGWFKD